MKMTLVLFALGVKLQVSALLDKTFRKRVRYINRSNDVSQMIDSSGRIRKRRSRLCFRKKSWICFQRWEKGILLLREIFRMLFGLLK